MTKEKRINYIDIVKGIGILAIVLGHVLGGIPYRYGVDLTKSSLYVFLFSFHVPLFYLISGILIGLNKREEGIKDFVIRKSKLYLWPYITFSLIAIISRVIFKLIYHETDIIEFVVKTIIKTVTGDGFLTLWFIPTLLLAEILFKLRELVSRKIAVALNIAIVLGCSCMSIVIKNQLLPISNTVLELVILINRIFTAYIFILIGSCLIRIKLKKKYYSIIAILIILLNIYMCQYNGNVDLKNSIMGENVVMFWYFAISTPLSIIVICKTLISKNRCLEYLGKNSLIIMATHFPIPFIEVLRKNNWEIPIYANVAAMFIILMIIELIMIYLINNYGRRVIKI